MGWKERKLWTLGRKAQVALIAALAVVFVSGSLFYVVAARNTSETSDTTNSAVQGIVYCASADNYFLNLSEWLATRRAVAPTTRSLLAKC